MVPMILAGNTFWHILHVIVVGRVGGCGVTSTGHAPQFGHLGGHFWCFSGLSWYMFISVFMVSPISKYHSCDFPAKPDCCW
jgi:hypothetical protein